MDIAIGELVKTTIHQIEGIGVVMQVNKEKKLYEVFWLDNQFFGTTDMVHLSEITNDW